VNPDPPLQFGPYRVDLGAAQIWKDRDRLHLTPKALSVLLHLIRERPRVVAKNELLDAVWPDVHVGEAVLKVAVREIRKALGDEAKQAIYVETAHRRGYRFLAPVTFADGPRGFAPTARRGTPGPLPPPASGPSGAHQPPLVGRDVSLASLDAAFALASRGHRQMVFVSGEAGIGKTSITEVFLAAVERDHGAWIARGQSVEHSIAQEPYLAVLDAFGRLLKQSGRSQVEAVLRRYAPTWVAQLPVLSSNDQSWQRETLGATPERMLREIAEALETLTADVTLILFLDDLHWADEATVDFVNLVARRTEPSRLLVIGTYRPADLALGPPALKTVRQDLQARGLCQDIALDLLTLVDVEAYLGARFGVHRFPHGFARFLHGRTDGNPLFLTNLLGHLVRERTLAEVDGHWTLQPDLEHIADVVPDSLRQLIDAMVARLGGNEQRALEAASVSGAEFTAAAVAAALDVAPAQAEEWLDSLVSRQHFVRSSGAGRLPDGTLSGRYAFTHSLFQHVLYQRMAAVVRMRLHLKVAQRGEVVYGPRVDEIAADLASHFERGCDHAKAIEYLRLASRKAVGRFANREACRGFERALAMTEALDEHARWEVQLDLLGELGHVRRSMGDMNGASESFLAAASLAESHDRTLPLVDALVLAASSLSWFDRAACLRVAARAEWHTRLLERPVQVYVRGYAAYWRLLWEGWRDEDARDCDEAVRIPLEDPSRRSTVLARGAYGRLLASDYAGALDAAQTGADLALVYGDAFGRLVAQFFRVWAAIMAGDWRDADRSCEDSLREAARNEHRQWHLLFRSLGAWILREGGDPQRAVEVARGALEAAHEVRFPFGQLLAQLQLGAALSESGAAESAAATLEDLDRRLSHERLLMDWVWRMPLDLELAELWRARGEAAAAEARARTVCDTATRCGERTWLALGHAAIAAALDDQGLRNEAEREMATALTLIAAGTSPVAARRVLTAAARMAAASGDAVGAERHHADLRALTTRR
jgi:DNA-binding winged helix-turn-helix (wHTH) protein